jgi:hypothetical protein
MSATLNIRAAQAGGFTCRAKAEGLGAMDAPVTPRPELVKHPVLKRCPRCERSKPVSGPRSGFGVCRARKDGLNLYCKKCINEKIAKSREALKAYKAARIKHAATDAGSASTLPVNAANFSPRRIARMLRKLSPSDRVREAIKLGARTQKEIAHVTRLPKDEVCDAIANLLLWTREIRTQMVNHTRMYFVKGVECPGCSRPITPNNAGGYRTFCERCVAAFPPFPADGKGHLIADGCRYPNFT